MGSRAVFIIFVMSVLHCTSGIELTFELPDSAKQCFYEMMAKEIPSLLEFQVVGGGQYDIDVTIQAPDKKIIYRQIRKQYNKHQFLPPLTGTYTICFDNEFSTFSHKLVYMRLQVGEEQDLPPYLDNLHVMTLMETSVDEIHSRLNSITELQTRHRLRESQGRRRAEEINERVMWWSIGETVAILVVILGGQLCIVVFGEEEDPHEEKYGVPDKGFVIIVLDDFNARIEREENEFH